MTATGKHTPEDADSRTAPARAVETLDSHGILCEASEAGHPARKQQGSPLCMQVYFVEKAADV